MAGEPALLDVVVRDQFGGHFAGGSGLVVCNRFRWVARGALPFFRGWLTKMIYSEWHTAVWICTGAAG